MKRYIVTSKRTQREFELNEDEYEKLGNRVNIQRMYTVREVPARKPIPKPEELKAVETPRSSRVVEPKTKKDD